MSYQKFKTNPYCMAGGNHCSTRSAEGDVAGQKFIFGRSI